MCIRDSGWVKDNGGQPVFYSGGDVDIYRVYNYGLKGCLLYTSHDECLKIVKNSEFVVFPSIWYEGCSMVEIETESLGVGLSLIHI